MGRRAPAPLDNLKGAPASRGRLLLAHPDAPYRRSVARERRDRPGVLEARPVPVARARADGPVRPRTQACTNAVTGPGLTFPWVLLQAANPWQLFLAMAAWLEKQASWSTQLFSPTLP